MSVDNKIEEIAKELKAPAWWLEGLAIEYLPCRKFGVGGNIWTFDFSQITLSQLRELAQQHRVVQYGRLFHNVRPEVLMARMIHKFISPVSLNLVDNITDIQPEGLVSGYHFPFLANSIDVWDPKLSFDDYCQVYDEGKVYQWRVAKFIIVEGRHYGKSVSDFLNLEPFDQITTAYQALASRKVPKDDPKFQAFVNSIIEFYKWIEQLRRPVFAELERLHQQWKKSSPNSEKVTDHEPPILSIFEKFKVEGGNIYTLATMAPLFFRACVHHCRQIKTLRQDMPAKKPDIHNLDQLYQEQAEALICATACLEALVNTIGFERFDSLWPSLENLSIEAKIQTLFHLFGKSAEFNTSIQPYQTLIELVKRRNTLIHFKPHYEKVVNLNSSSVTKLHKTLDHRFVSTLPTRLTQLIEAICCQCTFQVPSWLHKQNEWDV